MQSLDVVKLFGRHSEVMEVATGDTVFKQGDPGSEMYIVLEGEVSLPINDDDFDAVGPGNIFGELALIDSPTRSATAVAAAPSRPATVNEKRFLCMVREHPFFALYVMRVLADRIRKMNRLVHA